MSSTAESTPVAESLNHEPDRINRWVVLIGFVVIVASIVLTHAAVAIFVDVSREHRPLPRQPDPAIFPASRDWLDGSHELMRLHEREREHLETYQWLNPEHTAARIPIERAMQLLVEQGTPPGTARASEDQSHLSPARDAQEEQTKKGGPHP